jgi:hypothetical protein
MERFNKKIESVVRKLRNHPEYIHYSDQTLLNLSFRGGDKLHSQWTDEEEHQLLPILVQKGLKPVASVCQNPDIDISSCCSKYTIKNHWGMIVTCIYKTGSYSEKELFELANETNSWAKRGSMYGYT